MGFDDTTVHNGTTGYRRLKGNSAAVRQPSRTMFACDGLGGSTKTRLSGTWTAFNVPPNAPPQPWPSYTLWNNQAFAPVTLSDAITHRPDASGKLIAGDVANFDQARHRGKMNIAFCDGHVELRDIPAFTLATPTSLVPVFKTDPTAAGLMNVYLLAP